MTYEEIRKMFFSYDEKNGTQLAMYAHMAFRFAREGKRRYKASVSALKKFSEIEMRKSGENLFFAALELARMAGKAYAERMGENEID